MNIIFTVNPILIAAAVIPAIALLIHVEHADKLEKESAGLLFSLVLFGIASTAVAAFAERLGIQLLNTLLPGGGLLYDFLLCFIVIGLAEEGAKYILLKRRTWNNPEFNCQFDGVVYGAFVSLGFALWENLGYVAAYGLNTALIRAVTAVPGHACFGVFMGTWFGMAKRREGAGDLEGSRQMRVRALLVPTLLHGFYDFAATRASLAMNIVFVVFVIAMFITAYRLIKHVSENDSYIQNYRFHP